MPPRLHNIVRARLADLPATVVGAAVCLLLATASDAAVFHSRADLPSLAFPAADRVEARDFFLTVTQRTDIEKRAGGSLSSDLITVYEGFLGKKRLGYALLDTQIVRTLPATLLIVMDVEGRVAATYVMAFHEPLDYLPNKRWLELFAHRPLSSDLRIGRSIVGITGATLSAHAVAASVRRGLATYQVLLAGED